MIALVEHDRVVDVPAVGAGVPADDSPLVEVGRAEVRRARRLEPPGREEVVFRARAPDRGLFFAVDVDLLIAFAEPGGAARAHAEHCADVVALALGRKDHVVLAALGRILLSVLGVEVGRIIG